MGPIAVSAHASGSYGALELKHYYRKSMMLAVSLAAAAHLLVVGSILLWQTMTPGAVPADPPIVIVIDDLSDLRPPPSIIYDEPNFSAVPRDAASPEFGIPVPMPDDEVIEDVKFATRDDWAHLSVPVAGGVGFGDGDQIIVSIPVGGILPEPDEFVAFQEEPKTIHFEVPEYPEMAELTGQTGRVWVQALVDWEGRVRDARILKTSETNVGFEEAALRAAFKNIYRPAIQNGQPVAVWISYKVDFKLR